MFRLLLFVVLSVLTVDSSQPSRKTLLQSQQQRFLTLVRDGQLEQARKMVRGGLDVNYVRHGVTPLLIAARENQTELVTFLLEHGADPDPTETSTRVTPLWIAAFKNHIQVVQILLEHRATVDAENSRGITPLYVGAQQGHVSVMMMLIIHGAQVDHQSVTGATALMVACQGGHEAIVRILLDSEADPNIQTLEKKQSALWIASVLNLFRVVIALIMDPRLDPNLQALDGTTALCKCVEQGHEMLMRILVKEGQADVNIPDNRGRSPLHVACYRGNIDQVEFLLQHGADPDARTHMGDTPLSIALKSPSREFRSQLLILLGPNERNVEGENFSLESGSSAGLLFILTGLGIFLILLLGVSLFLVQKRFTKATRTETRTSDKELFPILSSSRRHVAIKPRGMEPSCSVHDPCFSPELVPHPLSPVILSAFSQTNSTASESKDHGVAKKDQIKAAVGAQLSKIDAEEELYCTELKESLTAEWPQFQGQVKGPLSCQPFSNKCSLSAKPCPTSGGPSTLLPLKEQGNCSARSLSKYHQEYRTPVVDKTLGIGNLTSDQSTHPSPRLSDHILSTSGEGWTLSQAYSGPYSFLEEWLKTKSQEDD